ncbi:DUF6710 family protein [Pseudomonas alliivorans]|nr:DUF6710 family protein [Pseudomonas alliivorans]MEE4970389.1 DUF6710 family protein [Pseudomonas alliivorans]MEE4975852.1 DUF6710 family protein [Pseudomonas alliivorans]MEE4980951.1 DUF6710 family protein [Pseudomonas alliivorans]MEE5001604.1 DUF6710 family protein [Pseudomonas alliivorans]
MYTTDSTNIAVYNHLMKVAKEIALTNPKGLPDLIRAILRPLQSEHLLAVAERGQDALPNLDGAWFFGSAVRDRLFSTSGSRWLGRPLPQNQYVLKLSRDIVLPWPWSLRGYVSALATIGSAKAPVAMSQTSTRPYNRNYQGPWVQDDNHSVHLWLPWGIGFVYGGNHSIAAGILAGEGEVIPEKVYDMSHLLDSLHCDGAYFYETDNGEKVEAVTDVRRAAVFEIGRLMGAQHS